MPSLSPPPPPTFSQIRGAALQQILSPALPWVALGWGARVVLQGLGPDLVDKPRLTPL